jgi:hypothetical protein
MMLVAMAHSALGQCADACGGVSSRLSSCSLPSLSDTLPDRPVQRNLTGLPDSASTWDTGPETFQIADYNQAECFCPEAVTQLDDCVQCFVDGDDDQGRGVARDYRSDCAEFGYFGNSTLSHPSTTRTTMPMATPAPGSDDGCKACGIIRGQIEECSLTPLDTDDKPDITTLGSPSTPFMGYVLLNRTAAECFCTLPVLRRLDACRECIIMADETKQRGVLDNFRADCNGLGYWTDSQIVQDDDENNSAPSATSAALAPTPSKAGAGRNRAGHLGIGCMSAAVVLMRFLFC